MPTTSKAAELAEMFETRTRDDGSEFVCLKDDSPEWAADFVREAHGTEMLPDDYRYRWIRDALDILKVAEEDTDDLAQEFGDDVDVYTPDLLAWVSSNLNRVGYCDEAMSEEMADPSKGFVGVLMAGQASERHEVFTKVALALESVAV